MTDNPRSFPPTDIFQQLSEEEALSRVWQAAESRWKISRALKILDRFGHLLEDARLDPPIDYQSLEEALAWMESLFRREEQDGKFAPELARLGIEVRKICNQNRQLILAWRTLAWQLQQAARDSLQALYYAVPTLKEEIDMISSRLRTPAADDYDQSLVELPSPSEEGKIVEFSKFLSSSKD